jgi:hypothetical protein
MFSITYKELQLSSNPLFEVTRQRKSGDFLIA